MAFTLPGGTIEFESEKVNGRHPAVGSGTAGGGGGTSSFSAQSGYSVTGDFSELGNEVTITKDGGGFGVKPGGEKALYVKLWEDGDGLEAGDTDGRQPNPDLSRQPYLTVGGTGRTSVQSSFVPPGGANAYQYAHTGTTGAGMVEFPFASQMKELMIARRATDFDENDVASNGHKVWRIWHEGTGNHNVYWDSNNKITTERLGANQTIASEGHRWSAIKNSFGDEKIRLKQADVDVQEAQTWWALNGSEIVSSQFFSQNSTEGSVGLLNWYVGCQEQGQDGLAGKNSYLSMIYFDDSWCHVVLSTSAVFSDSNGSSHQVCPVLTWGDSTISVHMRPRSGFTHLHVVDKDYNSYYVGEVVE